MACPYLLKALIMSLSKPLLSGISMAGPYTLQMSPMAFDTDSGLRRMGTVHWSGGRCNAYHNSGWDGLRVSLCHLVSISEAKSSASLSINSDPSLFK